MHPNDRFESRRQLLKWLAASPLLTFPGLAGLAAQTPSGWPQSRPDPVIWAPPNPHDLITRPEDAINVFDFEPVARRNIPPAHFGYMASGIDDEVTLRANREGFLKFQLRPRRLVDVSKVDMSTDILARGTPPRLSSRRLAAIARTTPRVNWRWRRERWPAIT